MIEKMPFGKTGHVSTRVLFGAAAFSGADQPTADRVLPVLLQYGINHIDVAASYGDAELRIGPWMKSRRADFFLATKTTERSRGKAGAEIRLSLKRLQTDHVDLLQLHAVTAWEEFEKAMGPDGALEAAVDARAKGLTRFIGITSHGLEAPSILRRALEHFEFASVLLPYNYPMMNNPNYAEGFNRLAALCREREVALQTIKSICRRPWAEGAERTTTTWYETLTGQDEIAKAVGYVLGQPQLFLNSASDVTLLPMVLEAASRFTSAPADSDMRALLSSREMFPLWRE
ncbi:MAG: aldo/keto reductase [Anaerolineales bacterium]|nr:aldo/keto reductase [Anaerolineales bacterium]